MNKQVLFIQGGGEAGYEVDAALAASLQTALGKGYDVHYPAIKSEEAEPDFGWMQQIGQQISAANNEMIIVGHSFGASMLLKYLSENAVNKKIAGIFLVAAPFWNGNEDWQAGLKLQQNFAGSLPAGAPIFFYHCLDDEEVPFNHLDHYTQKLTRATFLAIKEGGHQLNNDLTAVASDIKLLEHRHNQ